MIKSREELEVENAALRKRLYEPTYFQILWPTAVLLGVMTVFWVGFSAARRDAYEHVTGKHVDLFDAMFLDLKIYGEGK